MITSSYEEYNEYTSSIPESLDPRITPAEEIPTPEIMNPVADENLGEEDWSQVTELQYEDSLIDRTRPNAHEWHGWGTKSLFELRGTRFGGAVRNVLLSGSYAEVRKLRVDSDIDAEDINVTHDLTVQNNGYFPNEEGGIAVAGCVYVGPDDSQLGHLPYAGYGVYSDDSKLNYLGNLEASQLSASSASFSDLQVTDHTVLQGKTEISGDLDVGAPSYFQTTSVFKKDVYVDGNLYVEGSASYINTDELYIEDKSITVASGAASPEAADGAGFDIDGAGVEFHYDSQTDHMTLNKSLEILGTGSIIAPSGSIDDLTSNQINVANLTASYAQFTTASGYFTGSFVGDGSGLTGITASVSDSPKCKHIFNLEAGNTFSCTHPFKTQNVLVQVYKWRDSGYNPESDETADWEEPAIQVMDAEITVYPNPDTTSSDKYKVDITYPEALNGYVVIADAGLYVPTILSGSGALVLPSGTVGYVDIVEATREVRWFGNDGGLGIIPESASYYDTIEKGESYKFQHNLGTKNILVQVYRYYPRINEDTQEVLGWTPVQIYPEFIAINDINEVEIKFSTDPIEGEDPVLPQYFGYVVLGKAGCILKSYTIGSASLDEAGVHYGTSGSWSAEEFSADRLLGETVSTVNADVAENLQVKGYIDATKIGNLDTGEQYYGDLYDDQYGERLWGSYMEFTDTGIVSYVRNSVDDDEDQVLDVIPTASLLDPNGDLFLRGALHTNEVFSTSDIREKHNIETLENALDNVKKLRGVSFEWNKDGQKSIGTVAQEVQSIYPELTKVYRTLDGYERLAVNYEGLVGVLIEAVKSLAERVEQLEKNENR